MEGRIHSIYRSLAFTRGVRKALPPQGKDPTERLGKRAQPSSTRLYAFTLYNFTTCRMSLCTDAANDAHAGFVICKHLLKLAQSLPAGKIPKKVYYSFDSIGGSLFEPSTGFSPAKPWKPHNPDYDPGPPPPPRPPNPSQFPKASHVIVTSTSTSAMAAGTNSPVHGSRASHTSPKPRSGDSKVHYSTLSRGRGRGRGHPLRADTAHRRINGYVT